METIEQSNHNDYATLAGQARQARTQYLAQLVRSGWSTTSQWFNPQPPVAKPINRKLRANNRRV